MMIPMLVHLIWSQRSIMNTCAFRAEIKERGGLAAMNRMKRWAMTLVCAALVFTLLGSVPAFAASYAPYYAYEYNDYGESVDAPHRICPLGHPHRGFPGVTNFSGINDMYYDGDQRPFICWIPTTTALWWWIRRSGFSGFTTKYRMRRDSRWPSTAPWD